MYFNLFIISSVICVLLLWALFSPNVAYFIHSNWFEWKIDKNNSTKDYSKDCHIIYLPITKLYTAVYRDKYPFLTAEGSWTLFSRPSRYEMFKTEEEAIARLKHFLEFYGKDVIKIPIKN